MSRGKVVAVDSQKAGGRQDVADALMAFPMVLTRQPLLDESTDAAKWCYRGLTRNEIVGATKNEMLINLLFEQDFKDYSELLEAICLPRGSPPEKLDEFEKFQEIYLWSEEWRFGKIARTAYAGDPCTAVALSHAERCFLIDPSLRHLAADFLMRAYPDDFPSKLDPRVDSELLMALRGWRTGFAMEQRRGSAAFDGKIYKRIRNILNDETFYKRSHKSGVKHIKARLHEALPSTATEGIRPATKYNLCIPNP